MKMYDFHERTKQQFRNGSFFTKTIYIIPTIFFYLSILVAKFIVKTYSISLKLVKIFYEASFFAE